MENCGEDDNGNQVTSTQMEEIESKNLKSTASHLLIDSQRCKIEEYNTSNRRLENQEEPGDPGDTEFNPYEKIIKRNDKKELEEEKKTVRSPLLT